MSREQLKASLTSSATLNLKVSATQMKTRYTGTCGPLASISVLQIPSYDVKRSPNGLDSVYNLVHTLYNMTNLGYGEMNKLLNVHFEEVITWLTARIPVDEDKMDIS